MYDKQAAAQLTQQFWTVFGQYMAPILSAEGEKINWINYKTGEKHIRFTMQFFSGAAMIALEIAQPEIVLQQQQFEQPARFKNQFEQIAGNKWIWEKSICNEQQKIISQIKSTLPDINLFDKEDWPKIISFFKPRLIALDEFWSNYKFVLQH